MLAYCLTLTFIPPFLFEASESWQTFRRQAAKETDKKETWELCQRLQKTVTKKDQMLLFNPLLSVYVVILRPHVWKVWNVCNATWRLSLVKDNSPNSSLLKVRQIGWLIEPFSRSFLWIIDSLFRLHKSVHLDQKTSILGKVYFVTAGLQTPLRPLFHSWMNLLEWGDKCLWKPEDQIPFFTVQWI